VRKGGDTKVTASPRTKRYRTARFVVCERSETRTGRIISVESARGGPSRRTIDDGERASERARKKT
tara:strand:+ start:612 stop:809 length:198 start_codon:yes stop_codon:yes gene_type:complete